MGKLTDTLTLFASSSTLVCCALPALLVAVGAGAALAGLASNFPALIWMSEHKELSFGFSILMLLVAGIAQWRARTAPCPVDPVLAAQCMRTRAFSFRIYCLSFGIFLVGAFFAFIAPLLNAT
jgi:cytochrome b561